MAFPNCIGNKKFWTRERVDAALKTAAEELKGMLPTSDAGWNEVKKGRYDWPPAVHIYQYYHHSIARAWLTVGASLESVSFSYSKWTKKEDEYLLNNAGGQTLNEIAKHLGRTYPSCRGRLRWFKVQSRHNLGFFSAAELAKEYQCPYHRIRDALASGVIKGCFDEKRNRWDIDLGELTPVAMAVLEHPKQTYLNHRTDLGDYYQRYGITRRRN